MTVAGQGDNTKYNQTQVLLFSAFEIMALLQKLAKCAFSVHDICEDKVKGLRRALSLDKFRKHPTTFNCLRLYV